MNLNEVKTGLHVRTVGDLGDTEGMLIAKKHLDARRPYAVGVVWGYVPGHGGDVWWIKHEDGTIGAYMYDEFKAEQ